MLAEQALDQGGLGGDLRVVRGQVEGAVQERLGLPERGTGGGWVAAGDLQIGEFA